MSKSDYKQDLLVSIRYRNDLPPPPMPPKLLEIETGGLQQYLDPGFAAGLLKREEPNIEADAEGGMPIDVIGMYGYFEGDESSITAPEIAPPLDPEDEILMLPPEQLKNGGAVTGSTFLRKTQYMTATSAPANELRAQQSRVRRASLNKPVVMARDDTENVKRNIQKAFNLVYPASRTTDSNIPQSTQVERTAWEKPVHPEKKGLKPLAFYPVLPDFDSGTAIGPSWNLLRFDKPPLPAVKGHRDNRIDAAFLMTSEHPDKKAWELAKAAHQDKPADYDDPGNPPACWSLLLPQDQGATPLIQKIFNERDPEHADEGLLARAGEATANGELRIPLDRKKFYSNAVSQDKPVGRHTRQVVLSLPSKQQSSATTASTHSSAAHYYPIGQVNLLRSDRGKLGQQKRTTDGDIDEMQKVLPDQVMVLPHDPNMMELANMYYARDDFDPTFEVKMKAIMEQAEVEAAAINGVAQEDTNEGRQPPTAGEGEDIEMAEG